MGGAVSVAASSDGLALQGVLGAPDQARKTSAGVHLFVNGRPVSHRGLSYALYTGYGELLPKGRYPFACLFIQVDPALVDVNVHPAKREVRFREEPALKDFVISAVREALSEGLGARPLDLTGGGHRAGAPRRAGSQTGHVDWGGGGLFESPSEAAMSAASELFSVPAGMTDSSPGASQGEPLSGSEPVIWQIHDRYLLAPMRGGLLIVDQHAAHERVLYEQALRQLTGALAARQQLLFPLVLDLSPEQYALVEEVGPLLERIGFDVRPFGGHTVALEAVPASAERAGRQEEVFLSLLDDLESRGSSGSGVQEKIAASLSCHAAVRFGDRMEPGQRRALVDQLFACERPQVCPHGRPTHLVLTLEELDRRFER
jgi:DNA mismatch repair protein MutL